MTCFIANPIVCRAYAKCHGWQETFAHFFIKSHRRSSDHLSLSSGAISTYLKDPSIDSGRESSSDTNNLNIPLVPPQVFEISSSPDDPTKEKLIRQLELSPIIHTNLSRTFSSPRYSSLSNSILTPMTMSIDGRDVTPEYLRRNSEEYQAQTFDMITTPISREDLHHSLIKTETSNEISSVLFSSTQQAPSRIP